MSIDALWPYGVFAGKYRDREGPSDLMADWEPGDPDRLANFQRWRSKNLTKIKKNFWPEYKPEQNPIWEGKAAESAYDLTSEELDIMVKQLGFSTDTETARKTSEIYKYPTFGSQEKNHLYHYQVEDDVSIAAGENFLLYDPTLTGHEHNEFKRVATEALGEKDKAPTKSAGLFWFKFRLVRPRPFQTAKWFNTQDFACEIANTGFHSSAHSGHCMQGLHLGCAVFEYWLKEGYDLKKDQHRFDALAQYMIDWGDRRIFAGVHYPLDNIISWWLSYQLVHKIFEEPDLVAEFVSYAIQKRSKVFEIVRDHYTSKNLRKVRKKLIGTLPPHPRFDHFGNIVS